LNRALAARSRSGTATEHVAVAFCPGQAYLGRKGARSCTNSLARRAFLTPFWTPQANGLPLHSTPLSRCPVNLLKPANFRAPSNSVANPARSPRRCHRTVRQLCGCGDDAGIRIPSGHDRSGTSAGALTKAHHSPQGLPKEAMMPTDTARKAEEARSPIQIPPGV
jgi:hypothetical protein